MVNLFPFVRQQRRQPGTYGEAQQYEPPGTAHEIEQRRQRGGGITQRLQKMVPGGAAQAPAAMMQPARLIPGRPLPSITLPTVKGGRLQVGAPTGRWQLIVVHRGKHCPVSRNYLISLQQVHNELDAMDVEVIACSADPRERSEAFVDQLRAASDNKDISFKFAYGMTVSQMFMWGLYVSAPRNTRETDRPFPEPAIFLINTEGLLHIIDYSNSPFARTDLHILIEGIRYIQDQDYPIRGTYGLS